MIKRITAAQLAADEARRTASDVRVELVDVTIEIREYGLVVTPVYANVDRPNGTGIVAANPKIAARLTAAIRAGVTPVNAKVMRDTAGRTYVAAEHRVSARTLNADLRRLGF